PATPSTVRLIPAWRKSTGMEQPLLKNAEGLPPKRRQLPDPLASTQRLLVHNSLRYNTNA
ncbi:hypothetical protein LRQ20_29000, partial [Pseudomonas sp. MAFF 311096]